MTVKIKKILISLLVAATFLTAITGLFSLSAFVNADGYTCPIPEGCYLESDYEVLDVTPTELNSTTTNVKLSVGSAKAARFKFTNETSNIWSIDIAMFASGNAYKTNANEGSFYISIPNTTDKNISLSLASGSAGAISGYKLMPYDCPDFLTINTKNVGYDIEVGAPEVYNADGSKVGTLVYMEVEGVRLVEYFYENTSLPFAGDDFYIIENLVSGTHGTSITAFDQAAVDIGSANLTFDNTEYDFSGNPVTPVPFVTAIVEKDGVSYGTIVDSKYFDIVYENNDKPGSATAKLIFKGKYSGTTSANFNIAHAEDASSAVITLSKTIVTAKADKTPITPAIVSVHVGGKPLSTDYFDVVYENNVEPGTAKVILTFKNGYFGKATALFRINPILSKNHSLDANPTVLDLASVYGGEQKKIELTTSDEPDVTAGARFDMSGADVVRFKMTANANTWNTYFALFCSDRYYKGEQGNFHYSVPKNSSRQVSLSIVSGNNSAFKTFNTDLPEEYDFSSGVTTVNVEVGAIKVYFTEDDQTSYVGRMFYLELDGVRVSEYVYFNDTLKFADGNFFIGGNTDKIVIEEFDLGGQSQQLEANEPMGVIGAINSSISGQSGNGGQSVTPTKNYQSIITVLTVIIALVGSVLIVKNNKRKNQNRL